MKDKKTLVQKLATHFGVKTVENIDSVKEVDSENRTVKFIANTYFFIDSDQDMLITGCSLKSINDRGANSKATAKIKHQSDHVLNTRSVVGRLDVIEERMIENKSVLYCESHIPTTSKGNDDLINYQEGIYDNHSIGFRYKKIELAVKDSEIRTERELWNEFYPLALNPEKADEFGYFYVVKEIELFEVSVVSYGANELTPVISGKSKKNNDKIKSNLFDRLDEIKKYSKLNAESKADLKQIDLEMLQIKQIITDLSLTLPSEKNTLKNEKPFNNDTDENFKPEKTINFITNLQKHYKNEEI